MTTYVSLTGELVPDKLLDLPLSSANTLHHGDVLQFLGPSPLLVLVGGGQSVDGAERALYMALYAACADFFILHQMEILIGVFLLHTIQLPRSVSS